MPSGERRCDPLEIGGCCLGDGVAELRPTGYWYLEFPSQGSDPLPIVPAGN